MFQIVIRFSRSLVLFWKKFHLVLSEFYYSSLTNLDYKLLINSVEQTLFSHNRMRLFCFVLCKIISCPSGFVWGGCNFVTGLDAPFFGRLLLQNVGFDDFASSECKNALHQLLTSTLFNYLLEPKRFKFHKSPENSMNMILIASLLLRENF